MMIMDNIWSYVRRRQLNRMNSCMKTLLKLYNSLTPRKSSISSQMKRTYTATQGSICNLYKMSFHSFIYNCHSTISFHSVGSCIKMSTSEPSNTTSTPYCPLSGLPHREITSPFCPTCGIDCRPFRPPPTVANLANSAPSTHMVPGMRPGQTVGELRRAEQRIAARKPSTGTAPIPITIVLTVSMFHQQYLDDSWLKKGFQWKIKVTNVPQTITHIIITIQSEIHQVYPLWNMKYEDLMPEGDGNWLISTTVPTSKEGPCFLTVLANQPVLLSDVLQISNQTTTDGVIKTSTVYLC
jgi:hypothetical protein